MNDFSGAKFEKDNHNDMRGGLFRKKRVVFVICAAIIFFLVVELGVRAVLLALPKKEPMRREDLSLYPDKKMSAELYREDKELDSSKYSQYDSLVGWGRREYHAQYFNISADGTRHTWNPPVFPSTKAANVFVFGGSTVFGEGSRDGYTIPSEISKILNQDTKTVYLIKNYGVGGYSLIQNLAKLLALLRDGQRPDYVIFYGGFNDVLEVYNSGVPGMAGASNIVKTIFEEQIYASAWDKVVSGARDFFKNNCESCKLGMNVVRAVFPSFLHTPAYLQGIHKYTDEQIVDLAQKTALDYGVNFSNFIDSLADTFHFKVVFFWQPTILMEDKLIGEENELNAIEPFAYDQVAAKLYRQINNLIPTDPSKNLYNISDVLKDRTRECYIDAAHIAEECNRVVAKKITDVLRGRYIINASSRAIF